MKRLVLLLVITFGGAVCAQAADPHRSAVLAQAAPTQGAPQFCTEVYQPVCGTNASGMRITYSNACFARAAAATNVTPGECASAK